MVTKRRPQTKKKKEIVNMNSKPYDIVKQRMEDYSKKAKNYVEENPMKATIIVGVAGLVIGSMIGSAMGTMKNNHSRRYSLDFGMD